MNETWIITLTKGPLIKDIANQEDGLIGVKKKKPAGDERFTVDNQTVGEPWI